MKLFSSVCANQLWLENNWVGKIGKVFAPVLPLLFLFKITILKMLYSYLTGDWF